VIRGLYLVTDPVVIGDRALTDVVLSAVDGGAQVVQLREKAASARVFVERARALRELLEPRGVPLIINDRVDVALAAGAHGVHIGRNDMAYADARRLLGSDAIIGLSVETRVDVDEAERLDVDYLGVSPVFATATKTDTLGVWGIDGLADVRRRSRHTLVAIGGLNARNVAEVVRAGADAVAVVSAVCGAADPRAAAAELVSAMETAGQGRS
jgi:thiamine-phosphate pyrophosphorylase